MLSHHASDFMAAFFQPSLDISNAFSLSSLSHRPSTVACIRVSNSADAVLMPARRRDNISSCFDEFATAFFQSQPE
jgi:hypothetical protein